MDADEARNGLLKRRWQDVGKVGLEDNIARSRVMSEWNSLIADEHDDFADSDSYDGKGEEEGSGDHDDEDDEDDDNEEDDSFADEEETRAIEELVRAAFSHKLPKPIVRRLLTEQPCKRPRLHVNQAASISNAPTARERTAKVSSSSSSSSSKKTVQIQTPARTTTPSGPISSLRNQTNVATVRLSMSAPSLSVMDKKAAKELAVAKAFDIKPDDFLRKLISTEGVEYKTSPALSLKDFFLEITEDCVQAYTMPVVQAVRDENIQALRELLNSGRALQCCSKFGDSIVHSACRRGSAPVLRFLLQEAGVSCRVCCDYGRTALHDACWTPQPNFEVIDMLLDACPDLLYITDKRGFNPLAYVRREHWADWCHFFNARGASKLVPRQLR